MPGQRLGLKTYAGGGVFEAVIGDLLDEPAECIVNAANGGLSHGGGVAAAISEAAGPALDRDGDRIVRERGPIPVGEAVATTAGRLSFKAVIHAVGPRLGQGNEEDLLTRALRAAFRIAHQKGWASLSFPAVSSGIFAVPAATCARAYLRAVDEFFAECPGSPLKTIRLALYKGAVADAVRARLEAA